LYALISPNQSVYDQANNILGSAVVEFSSENFDVRSPLMWVDVDDSYVDVDCKFYYFSSETNQVIKMSESLIQEKIELETKNSAEVIKQSNDLDRLIDSLVAKKLAELTSNNSSNTLFSNT
jgi:hypothetical protein